VRSKEDADNIANVKKLGRSLLRAEEEAPQEEGQSNKGEEV